LPPRTAVAHRVGSADDFPLNEFRIIEIGKREIGVVRTQEGFFALKNSCPHMLAPLCKGYVTGTFLPSAPDEYEYAEEGRIVRCPWHGWEFWLHDGTSVYGVVKDRAITYPVEATAEGVFVYVKE
jgi:nitrite reductase/ring-hydroxylating ferredoxin subunit